VRGPVCWANLKHFWNPGDTLSGHWCPECQGPFNMLPTKFYGLESWGWAATADIFIKYAFCAHLHHNQFWRHRLSAGHINRKDVWSHLLNWAIPSFSEGPIAYLVVYLYSLKYSLGRHGQHDFSKLRKFPSQNWVLHQNVGNITQNAPVFCLMPGRIL